jgi:hypothetical protein
MFNDTYPLAITTIHLIRYTTLQDLQVQLQMMS